MSVATVAQVLDSARSHLGDDDATLWTDPKLMPKFQQAHRALQLQLILAGVPVINAVSSVLSVPIGMTDLSLAVGYPLDLIEPIWMKERAQGELTQDFYDMTEVDFIPSVVQSTELCYWCWYQQKIIFLGALQNREVQLRYRRNLTTPTIVTQDIGVLLGELYLSYMTAYLAKGSVSKGGVDFQQLATMYLDQVIRAAVKEMQNLPAKRRPYHRGRNHIRVGGLL